MTATVAVGAVRLLTLRQLTIVLWTAVAMVVAMTVVVGQQYIWLIERHDYLRTAEISGTYNSVRAPGLLRLFHERGHGTIHVVCPFQPDGSPEPYLCQKVISRSNCILDNIWRPLESGGPMSISTYRLAAPSDSTKCWTLDFSTADPSGKLSIAV